jgi:hypothetical protein
MPRARGHAASNEGFGHGAQRARTGVLYLSYDRRQARPMAQIENNLAT